MRENRMSGSEGGAMQTNASSLPLSFFWSGSAKPAYPTAKRPPEKPGAGSVYSMSSLAAFEDDPDEKLVLSVYRVYAV